MTFNQILKQANHPVSLAYSAEEMQVELESLLCVKNTEIDAEGNILIECNDTSDLQCHLFGAYPSIYSASWSLHPFPTTPRPRPQPHGVDEKGEWWYLTSLHEEIRRYPTSYAFAREAYPAAFSDK